MYLTWDFHFKRRKELDFCVKYYIYQDFISVENMYNKNELIFAIWKILIDFGYSQIHTQINNFIQ